MKEKKFRFISRSSDSRNSVVIFHIAMICSVCVCVCVYKLFFLTLVWLGLLIFPSICILSPSNNSLEGLHRSLEIINLPALALLLGYENLEGRSITWSVFVSLAPGTVPDMHACIHSTPMYQSSAGCCVLGTQQWMKRDTVTTLTELTDELKRHINHIIKQIM